ncbi:unnamed protein product [Clonostachys rhizophaga]|uniref:Uncharacterized protein n=1 Tax=Clonostachys rhizophaga TaxID=160324 RepID=A0A9N9VAY9_9HYPO|nr:unnamed protein product [Clonostachys rhizophaga]
MGMGPGPGSWPLCFNKYTKRWVTIPTPEDERFEFQYYATPETTPNQPLDLLIDDLGMVHSISESLPYVVLTGGVIEVSEPVEAGDMDHAPSARDVILDMGLENEYTISN